MKNKLINKKGMTIVETVAALAIISLASLMMATGFLAAATLVRRSMELNTSGATAASQAERLSLTPTAGEAGAIRLQLQTGEIVIVDGRCFSAEDAQTGVKFTIFETE